MGKNYRSKVIMVCVTTHHGHNYIKTLIFTLIFFFNLAMLFFLSSQYHITYFSQDIDISYSLIIESAILIFFSSVLSIAMLHGTVPTTQHYMVRLGMPIKHSEFILYHYIYFMFNYFFVFTLKRLLRCINTKTIWNLQKQLYDNAKVF